MPKRRKTQKHDPLFSLLCPSYGRPEMLKNMLDSLEKTCTVHGRHIQILIKIDDDDPKADGYFALADKYEFRIKVIQSPQRGYFENDKAYNLMFEHVISPIIWIVNDDILIKGDWCGGLKMFDDISSNYYKDGIAVGSFQHRANFPVVRTDFCKKIGMITCSFAADGFMTIIARMYRRMVQLPPIFIHHVFPEPTLNSVRSKAFKPRVTKGYDYDLNEVVEVIKKCDKFYIKTPHHRSIHKSYKTKKSWPICNAIRRRMKKR